MPVGRVLIAIAAAVITVVGVVFSDHRFWR